MNLKALVAPGLADIRAAAEVLAPYIRRSPLVELSLEGRSRRIFLKLESFQVIGAFKARPVGNVLLNADAVALRQGVYTASSGNAGLGLAWMAGQLDLAARVYAPEFAPPDKLKAIADFGADVVTISDDAWWQIIVNCNHRDDPGLYVDAVRDPLALAGNGTIGLEIVEQCPAVDTVILPFGGGGLSCSTAAAMRALKPDVRVVVAECDAAAPVTAALRAGKPVTIETQATFISGAGAPTVLDEMWPLVRESIDETIVVPITGVADAIRMLFARNKIIAEGAGALALAGALATDDKPGTTVCVVSGGNIDAAVMASILRNEES
jgi:threonine dehydratase